MLNTLNKAWLEIMAKQLNEGIIEDCLCVCTNKEFSMIKEIINKYKCHGFYVIFIDELNTYSYFQASSNEKQSILPIPIDRIYGDILISHDLHDSMIINFLHKHRKRKC